MRSRLLNSTLALALGLGLTGTAGADTAIKDYVVPIGGAYEVDAILSVGDDLPQTGEAGDLYQMIGIPDGLGAYDDPTNGPVLFMNHELTQPTTSRPEVGDPRYRGAFVSEYLLDTDGDPISGRRAYDTVYQDDVLIGPAADEGNSTPGFSRFCSGALAWTDHGFDRPIYLTGEETEGASTFDGKGGQTVAVFDNEAHALSELGHFAKENTLVQPAHKEDPTVVFPMEDGPATLNNQLYMYVGEKDTSPGGTVLERNGLVGGSLYLFRSLDSRNSEATFTSGTVKGEWVEIPDAGSMTDTELEAASDAVDAFTFVRPEDGAFNLKHRDLFHFVTTGSSTGADDGVNELGRLYTLRLHHGKNLLKKGAELHIEYNADHVVTAGGDTAISPDNMDVSKSSLVINEDGTTESRAVMGSKGRDGSIWEFPIRGGHWTEHIRVDERSRVAELDPPGRNGSPPDGAVGSGVWETSGIIDVLGILTDAVWLTDVQAHSPTPAPEADTVEDGQLVVLRPA